MSRLSDLYKAMETLRKEGLSLNDDLEKQVSELEENIIQKEILPIVTESIEPALKQVKRELVLVVDYVPDCPISVHLSRKRNLTDIMDAKEILPDPQVEHKEYSRIGPKTQIGPATKMKITFTDGRVIQGAHAAETFCKFVIEVGVERVRSLGLSQCNIPLVSNTLDNKYARTQKPLGDGWYLMTKSNNLRKKMFVEKIATAFGLDLKVEIL